MAIAIEGRLSPTLSSGNRRLPCLVCMMLLLVVVEKRSYPSHVVFFYMLS